jgi:D-alanyl-D-alanine carboxypeptidase/D-alanyl-D-alanine-endopeptidase (penicillin-binding protein 4)
VQALIESSGLPGTSFGLHVQPVSRAGMPLVSLNADMPFQMASTIKLVTALATLELLGPAYRWLTHAHLEGTLQEGRLLGDLIIAGGGDPSLSAESLRQWFTQLRERGLREVWGDIVLDRFAFDLRESDHARTPPLTPDQPRYARPDGLMLDAGVLRVGLRSMPREPALVQLMPRQAGLPVVNHLTPGSHCSATAQFEQSAGEERLAVRGEWTAACGDREIAQLAIPHVDLTGRAVAELWRESGGRLKGRVRGRVQTMRDDGPAPGPAGAGLEPWASLPSPPLSALVHTMNKVSDNLIARTLLLSLASGFPQQAATLPAARARVAGWLRAQGLAAGDIVVDNGAGLSHTERGKPRALVQLLLGAWRGPHARPFLDSLPIAGIDGTLWRRMTAGPATGRAHLKTGSGIETRALAGYVRCQSGRVQALAAFVNHPDAAGATPVLDAVVEWVAANG